jgi:hypothetical protein
MNKKLDLYAIYLTYPLSGADIQDALKITLSKGIETMLYLSSARKHRL